MGRKNNGDWRDSRDGCLPSQARTPVLRCSKRQGLDAGPDAWGVLQLDAAQLVLALQIEPELPAHAKERGQGNGGFEVDGTLAFDDLVELQILQANRGAAFRHAIKHHQALVLEVSNRKAGITLR